MFDGHGGESCSEHAAMHLGRHIQSRTDSGSDIDTVLHDSFKAVDDEYKVDGELSNDGTTAVVALIHEKSLTVANVGDSRAILICHDGTVHLLTDDHKPDRSDEKARIEGIGGEVQQEEGDVARVNGLLAVSRALGDYYLKPFVTATPEITKREICSNDAFILLASDGLWDDVSSAECGRAILDRGMASGARHLMETALERGSMDNICIVVADLNKISFDEASSASAATFSASSKDEKSSSATNGGDADERVKAESSGMVRRRSVRLKK